MHPIRTSEDTMRVSLRYLYRVAATPNNHYRMQYRPRNGIEWFDGALEYSNIQDAHEAITNMICFDNHASVVVPMADAAVNDNTPRPSLHSNELLGTLMHLTNTVKDMLDAKALAPSTAQQWQRIMGALQVADHAINRHGDSYVQPK